MPYFAVIKVIIKITALGLCPYPFQISGQFLTLADTLSIVAQSRLVAINEGWERIRAFSLLELWLVFSQ